MTDHICFVGAKGGQGTSTVAAMVALAASSDRKVYLSGPVRGDLCAILGVPDGGINRVNENLFVGSVGGAVATADLEVHDYGTLAPDDSIDWSVDEKVYLALRGPCYLALHRVMVDGQPPKDLAGVVLVAEAGRALTKDDVEAVLGLPVVATVNVTESMARTIDAGLLAMRPDKVPAGLARLVPAREGSNA